MSVLDRLLFRQDPSSVIREGEIGQKLNFLNMLDPNSVTRESETARLFNLIKMADPQSTLREGETATLFENAGKAPSNLVDLYNSVLREGKMLTDEQRSNINSVLREGEMMADPDSVIREGEFLTGRMPTEQQMNSYTKALSDNEFRSFLLNEIPNGQKILEMLLQGNTPENFSTLVPLLNQFTDFKIANEMQQKGAIPPKSDILSDEELRFIDRLRNRREGSPMEGEESDAVGIADGLDRETPPADPTSDGIAKVSPEQYVQLMNEIRGDDVPMEGRVQELAGVVGEKDAQDTPLSVLALVQPVFELQEQQGIGATQQAQDMMPTASAQLNQPMSDGIVRAQTGLFADLSTVTGRSPVEMEALANIFGVDQTPVDISQRSKELTDMFLQQADLKNKALLSAAPSLLKIGSTILDPEAETSDIFTDIATEVARVGTNIGAIKDPYVKAGLTQAFAEEADRKKLFNEFRKTIGSEAVKKIFTEEEYITDGYTGFTVGKISGLPRPDQITAYYDKKRELDFTNSQKVAAMNSIEALIPLAQGDPEQIAMIRTNPEEWLKNNRDKTQGLSEKDRNSQENTLREEYAKNNKNFIVQADSFAKIKTSAANPSPAGDLSLIFSFMRMLDPQSTVRDSEFQNAANAAPLLTKLGIDFNKISTVWEGKTLTDNQRKDFLNKTLALYNQGKAGYDRLTNAYTDLAELYGVRPEAVIGIDFSLPDANIDIEGATLEGGYIDSLDNYDLQKLNPNPRAPN
jgi:flagellar biosynthesis/type III secretory pathway chaperone